MTVSELINELQNFAPDTKVVVRGYEDGYNDILRLNPIKIKKAQETHWYVGEYDRSSDEDSMKAIDLFGENTNAKG